MTAITQSRDVYCARQMAVSLIASHLNLWNTRPTNTDEAEELLEDLHIFGTDEDAEFSMDVAEHYAVKMIGVGI